MTTPSNPQPAGDDRNLVPVDETSAVAFEDKLHVFWRKNGGIVLGVCVAILLGILGKGAWEYFQKQKDVEIAQAYAAANTTEQLKAFAAAHGGHSLAGIAQLRIADEAYAAGKFADAIGGYEKALEVLKEGPLATRAQMGRALAKAQTGKAPEATNELKQLADDAKQLDATRAEAAYHLASIAAEAGNVADAQKYVTQVSQLSADPRGNPWVSRAMALQMNLPRPTEGSPAPEAPPAAPKSDEAGSAAPIKLPGK